MSLKFDPQDLGVKDQSRQELAGEVHLSVQAAKQYFSTASEANFQQRYNRFVAAFPREAPRISALRPEGVGPGEMIAWFVFDNIQLGGKNSSIDLLCDGVPFAEMKGGEYAKSLHALRDFKLTKDSDPAVALLLQDLNRFNELYRKITGADLPDWTAGIANCSALQGWDSIDLLHLSPHRTAKVYVPFSPCGKVFSPNDEELIISHCDALDLGEKIKLLALTSCKIAVDSSISTIRKIIDRWRDQAFIDYINGKRLALVNNRTLRMEFFGELTKEMVGLYRVARNQPKACVYLPKAGGN